MQIIRLFCSYILVYTAAIKRLCQNNWSCIWHIKIAIERAGNKGSTEVSSSFKAVVIHYGNEWDDETSKHQSQKRLRMDIAATYTYVHGYFTNILLIYYSWQIPKPNETLQIWQKHIAFKFHVGKQNNCTLLTDDFKAVPISIFRSYNIPPS